MSGDYDVRSVIICDDIRKEDNGKLILIGVYNDVIIVPSVPADLPGFAMCIFFQGKESSFEQKIEIRGPDDEQLAAAAGRISIADKTRPFASVVKFGASVFAKEGTYKILLGLDKEPEVISTFRVRVGSALVKRA